MATEGVPRSEYDPAVVPKLLGETARVMRAFGLARTHVVIVGGLVPPLLVPRPDAGTEPHIGTQDLDLCLSVALINGEVGAYENLQKSLMGLRFEMVDPKGWRWRGGVELPLTVEFLCPPEPGREPGRLFRPRGLAGAKLSALTIATGGLVDRDFLVKEVDVTLPASEGKTRQELKVVGPAAYLATKADALRGRNKPKDAYDIVWLVESWPGGQAGLAPVIRASPIFEDEVFRKHLDILRQEFAGIDSAGARKYAHMMKEPGLDQDQLARRAVGAIKLLMEELKVV